MILFGYRVNELLKKTWSEIWKDNVFGISAESAYNLFFSIFPLFLFLAPLLSFAGNKEALIGDVLWRISPFVPPEAMEVVEGVVRDVVFSKTAPVVMSVGALLAAYAGSNMIATLAGALNRAYGVTDPRPYLKRKLLALVVMIVLGFGIAFSTTLLLAGQSQMTGLIRIAGVEPQAAAAWRVLQYPAAFLVIVALFWILYYFLPAIKQNKVHVLAGSVFAATLWVGVTLLFRFYVGRFGIYNQTYGVIGGVIILLTWMWWTMFVILAGGELNSEIEKGTGAVTARHPVLFGSRIATTEERGHSSTKLP